MTEYKDQHYVQRAYLEHFTRDGMQQVYDKQQDKTFPRAPQKIGFERDFYELPTTRLPDGSNVPRALVERALGRGEGAFARALVDAIAGLDAHQRFDPAQKEAISVFIFIQRMRTPGYRKGIAA